ncbi:MAG: AbrB family transcriptional regulator [Leptolyngbyaceae bacterium]|nr:AbrB family transcriptional regulator [Leptolyngbyaceae bacterium]
MAVDTLEQTLAQYESHSDFPLIQDISQISRMARIKQIGAQLGWAIATGLLANGLGIPVGWLLGPMMAGVIYVSMRQQAKPLPPFFMTSAKALLGVASAVRFSPETLTLAISYAVPVVFCIAITASLSLFYGYLLSRWSDVDQTTGILSFVPGMASTIVALGEEMGADAVSIALLQYIRVILVVLIIPALAKFLFAETAISFDASLDLLSFSDVTIGIGDSCFNIALNMVVVTGCSILGVWAGQRLRLPAAGYLGPFVLGLGVLWLSPLTPSIPQWLFSMALLFVGLSIGLKFDWKTARKLWKAVIIDIILVLLLSLMCLGIGYGFHAMTQVDTVTSVLGFTPGGIEAMIATVMELGGDTGLVLAMQLTRMLLIILFAPGLITFFASRKTQEKPEKLPG